ncbi:erythromycin esterase family protein [Dactylosporangium sp. NPDC005555]|uniref:erythromycin esterase family protein n=1 Tax=Dactylosporangium sp. NPDC005555 TaxID=3154889 RepID=UPI0033AAC42E
MTDSVDAAAVHRLLPAQPLVLALGEPTHGEDVLLEVRNDLFRQLVEASPYPAPFRTIAVESDCLKALVVDDYVTGGPGTLDDVMTAGFSHGWGTAAPNRDLVAWIRAHNTGRPLPDRIRFAGLDGPLELTTGPAAPREAVTTLHTLLAAAVPTDLLPCTATELDELLGDDTRWTDQAAIMDPTRSIGRTPDAARLRLLCDDLVALLDAHAPALVATATRDGWDRARLYARTATGLLRYHHWMADTTPARLTHLVALRGAILAGNLLALTERGPALVHAHNAHLQRDQSSMQLGGHHLTWWSTGAIIEAHLGATSNRIRPSAHHDADGERPGRPSLPGTADDAANLGTTRDLVEQPSSIAAPSDPPAPGAATNPPSNPSGNPPAPGAARNLPSNMIAPGAAGNPAQLGVAGGRAASADHLGRTRAEAADDRVTQPGPSGYAFLFTALGTIHHHGVGTPPADTVEGHLYAQPGDRCVTAPRTLLDAFGGTPPAARVSAWFGYAPLDPAHLPNYDGVVFIKDSPPAAPGE